MSGSLAFTSYGVLEECSSKPVEKWYWVTYKIGPSFWQNNRGYKITKGPQRTFIVSMKNMLLDVEYFLNHCIMAPYLGPLVELNRLFLNSHLSDKFSQLKLQPLRMVVTKNMKVWDVWMMDGTGRRTTWMIEMKISVLVSNIFGAAHSTGCVSSVQPGQAPQSQDIQRLCCFRTSVLARFPPVVIIIFIEWPAGYFSAWRRFD